MASTSMRAATAALKRLPAASVSLSRAVPRAAAAAGQRSFFASWVSSRRAAVAGVSARRFGAVGARRWRHDGGMEKKGEGEVVGEKEKETAMLGFDEVNALVQNAAPSRPRMHNYLSNQDAPLLIDVRTPAEYAAGAIPCAVNLPVNSHVDSLFATPEDFEDRLGFPKPAADRRLVFYCKAGVRSHAAAALAKQAGYTNVGEYPGSWLDWERRGGEVAKEQDLLKEE